VNHGFGQFIAQWTCTW